MQWKSSEFTVLSVGNTSQQKMEKPKLIANDSMECKKINK